MSNVTGVTVLGRPFKPVAAGVSVMMIGLIVLTVFRLGTLPTFFTYAAASAAGIALVLFTVGYIMNRSRLTEAALLVATFAYMARSAYLLLTDPGGDSVLLAIGTTVIIAGSYVLEVQDRRGREMLKR